MISAYEAKLLTQRSRQEIAEEEVKNVEGEVRNAAMTGKSSVELGFIPSILAIDILIHNGYRVSSSSLTSGNSPIVTVDWG